MLVLSEKAFSFYVLSTSFLRNGYMEVRKLYTLHIGKRIYTCKRRKETFCTDSIRYYFASDISGFEAGMLIFHNFAQNCICYWTEYNQIIKDSGIGEKEIVFAYIKDLR